MTIIIGAIFMGFTVLFLIGAAVVMGLIEICWIEIIMILAAIVAACIYGERKENEKARK